MKEEPILIRKRQGDAETYKNKQVINFNSVAQEKQGYLKQPCIITLMDKASTITNT